MAHASRAQRRARRNVERLRAFAEDARVLPILVQLDPDPDAMASALAVRRLLDRAADASPIVTLGSIRRPENRRMARLLDLRVTRITQDELRGFARAVAVDTQPFVAPPPVFAIIDHHPPHQDRYQAELTDIRPDVGAASTILTEYLRAAGEALIDDALATALLMGIRTDTDLLLRGTAPADVEAYAFLQERADLDLLRRMSRPSVSHDVMQALGMALAGMRRRDGVAVAFIGACDPDDSHIATSVADFALALEGVSIAAAATVQNDALVLNIRRAGHAPDAGAVARELAETAGAGGGHASMARVEIPGERIGDVPTDVADPRATEAVLALVIEAVERIKATGDRGGPARSDQAEDRAQQS